MSGADAGPLPDGGRIWSAPASMKASQIRIDRRDHQVDVERQFGVLAQGSQDGRAEAHVRNEMAVHDVQMQPIGAGRFDRGDFLPQPAEIGGQQAWSNGDVPRIGSAHVLFLDTVADVTQGGIAHHGSVRRRAAGPGLVVCVAHRDERLVTKKPGSSRSWRFLNILRLSGTRSWCVQPRHHWFGIAAIDGRNVGSSAKWPLRAVGYADHVIIVGAARSRGETEALESPRAAGMAVCAKPGTVHPMRQ